MSVTCEVDKIGIQGKNQRGGAGRPQHSRKNCQEVFVLIFKFVSSIYFENFLYLDSRLNINIKGLILSLFKGIIQYKIAEPNSDISKALYHLLEMTYKCM